MKCIILTALLLAHASTGSAMTQEQRASRPEWEAGWDDDIPMKGGLDGLTIVEAAHQGKTSVVKELINSCAHITPPYRTCINKKDKNGHTALMFASIHGHTEIVEILIKANADITPLKKGTGWTAKAEINAKNDDGSTALMFASFHGHAEIVKILMKADADINVKGGNGWTALIEASFSGHMEVVQLLVKAKANVNAKSENNDTARIKASDKGHMEIVQLLEFHEGL